MIRQRARIGTKGLGLEELDAESGEGGREGGHGPHTIDVHLNGGREGGREGGKEGGRLGQIKNK